MRNYLLSISNEHTMTIGQPLQNSSFQFFRKLFKYVYVLLRIKVPFHRILSRFITSLLKFNTEFSYPNGITLNVGNEVCNS